MTGSTSVSAGTVRLHVVSITESEHIVPVLGIFKTDAVAGGMNSVDIVKDSGECDLEDGRVDSFRSRELTDTNL
jgi:hypothetical protein